MVVGMGSSKHSTVRPLTITVLVGLVLELLLGQSIHWENTKGAFTSLRVVLVLHWEVFFLMGFWLVSEVWVLVVRGLVFICFYCVDLLVFILSVVGGWLASLVS